jgi:hypothetical protein
LSAPAPLVLSLSVQRNLRSLRQTAEASPMSVFAIAELVETPEGEAFYRKQLSKLTVKIPGAFDYSVTFSVEAGHPAGPCRHMSMSVNRPGRKPNSLAVMMVAEEFGFTGSLDEWIVWDEPLDDRRAAVNIVQPLN